MFRPLDAVNDNAELEVDHFQLRVVWSVVNAWHVIAAGGYLKKKYECLSWFDRSQKGGWGHTRHRTHPSVNMHATHAPLTIGIQTP